MICQSMGPVTEASYLVIGDDVHGCISVHVVVGRQLLIPEREPWPGRGSRSITSSPAQK